MSNEKLQRKGGQWKEKQYSLFFSFIFGAGEKASFFLTKTVHIKLLRISLRTISNSGGDFIKR